MIAVTTADIALWVAIASASVSLTSLLWQLTLYRLSGARLIIRLVPAVLTEVGHIVRGPPKGWRPSMPEGMNIVRDRPWVDVAVIEIVNIGRAPISLSSIHLDVGAAPRWKLWKRHTVGTAPIAVHDGLEEVGEVRLEAARAVSVIFDFWPAVEAGRRRRNRVHLRASVRPAGRWAKRSPWRHRWTIGPDQDHLWPYGPGGDQVKLFQAVWRAIAPTAPDAVYEAWLSIVGLLLSDEVDPKRINLLDVSQALERILDSPMQAMWLSTSILVALRRHGQAGAWMPSPGKREPGLGDTPPTR